MKEKVCLANITTGEVVRVNLHAKVPSRPTAEDLITYSGNLGTKPNGVLADWQYTTKEVYRQYRESLSNPNIPAPKFSIIRKNKDDEEETILCHIILPAINAGTHISSAPDKPQHGYQKHIQVVDMGYDDPINVPVVNKEGIITAVHELRKKRKPRIIVHRVTVGYCPKCVKLKHRR